MQKLEKNNEQSLRYLKTNRRTTDRQGRLIRTPSEEPGIQNDKKVAVESIKKGCGIYSCPGKLLLQVND